MLYFVLIQLLGLICYLLKFYRFAWVLLFLQILLPHTADLLTYREAVSYPFIFEPLFGLSLYFLGTVFSPEIVITIVQVVLKLISGLAIKNNTEWVFEKGLHFSLLSVPVLLSGHNALRQGIAAIIVLYGFSLRSIFFRGLVNIAALLTHYSSLAFVFLLSKKKFLWIGLLTVFGLVIFPYVIHKYGGYLEWDTFSTGTRSRPIVKSMVLVVITLFTLPKRAFDVFWLKIYFLLVLVILSLFQSMSELFSRLMLYYLFLELIYIIDYRVPGKARLFLAASSVFAPNLLRLWA